MKCKQSQFKIRKLPVKLLISIICLCLLLIGCSSPVGQQPANSSEQQAVNYTIADAKGDWGFPSPWGHYQRGPGYIRMSLLFDTLIWKDAQGFVPALASEWEYDQSSRTYSFKLRDDAYWHDGQKLTAGDVVFTWEYMQAHPYPWVDLRCIENVEAVSDYQLKVVLKNEYAPFLANIAATLPIIPKHIWEEVQEPEKYTDALATVGSGPFKLVDYNKEHGTYLYQANQDYYGGEVRAQQLKFVKVNPQMTAAALKKGELDAAAIQPEMQEQLKGEFTIISEAGSSNVKLMFNHQQAPLNNKEFRQALAYAINREELTAKALRGYGLPGAPWLYTSNNSWYSPKAEQYEYDLQKAEEILIKLGYKLKASGDGREQGYWSKEGREVKLNLLCDADQIRAAEVIKEQLAKAGIIIDIKSVESQTRDARLLAWDFDLALNSHGGLGSDPNLLHKFILAEDFNSARYHSNRQLVDLIDRQSSLMDQDERKRVVRQIQNIVAEEVPFLTLYYPQAYWAHNDKASLFYTEEGIAIGVPLPLNKLSFIRQDGV